MKTSLKYQLKWRYDVDDVRRRDNRDRLIEIYGILCRLMVQSTRI